MGAPEFTGPIGDDAALLNRRPCEASDAPSNAFFMKSRRVGRVPVDSVAMVMLSNLATVAAPISEAVRVSFLLFGRKILRIFCAHGGLF